MNFTSAATTYWYVSATLRNIKVFGGKELGDIGHKNAYPNALEQWQYRASDNLPCQFSRLEPAWHAWFFT